MGSAATYRCDGCGQEASGGHAAERLQRLEWATRFRPVHINLLFLGAVAPPDQAEFLYAQAGEATESGSSQAFQGEGRLVVLAAGIEHLAGKDAESRTATLAEFQRRGYFLTHILECPVRGPALPGIGLTDYLSRQFPAAMTRIRRSFRPRRIALISKALSDLVPRIRSVELGAEIMLDSGAPFFLDDTGDAAAGAAARLQAVLAATEARK